MASPKTEPQIPNTSLETTGQGLREEAHLSPDLSNWEYSRPDLLKRNEEVNSEKTICCDFMVKSYKLT